MCYPEFEQPNHPSLQSVAGQQQANSLKKNKRESELDAFFQLLKFGLGIAGLSASSGPAQAVRKIALALK